MVKFRAWDKVSETMHKVEGIRFGINGARVISLAEMNRYNNNHTRWHTDVELLQSTGLKDKNGVEIFEGDVLKVFIFDGKGPHAKVIFKNGMFGIEDDMFGYGYDKGLYTLDQIISIRDAEVIGNIYEHPHLLEGDNE